MLTWKHVDLNNGIVSMKVGGTKNDDARTVYLDEELKAIFQNQGNCERSMVLLLHSYLPINRPEVIQFSKNLKVSSWLRPPGSGKQTALIDLYRQDGSLLERHGISAPGRTPVRLPKK